MLPVTIFELDAIEKASIREFLESVEWDERAVLDYGSGQEPYRELLEEVGCDYWPYDRKQFGGNVSRDDVGAPELLTEKWDAILSTQVVQYVPSAPTWLNHVHGMLKEGGLLILTYPSTWPVIRDELWHFTQLGMEMLLRQAGFEIVRHELRAVIPMDGFEIPIGYGVVARA